MDPNYVPPTTTTTKRPDCGAKIYKGDGNCDDNNNRKSCDWDGGDCCGKLKKKNKLYCKKVINVVIQYKERENEV